jgi:hypothetical protein
MTSLQSFVVLGWFVAFEKSATERSNIKYCVLLNKFPSETLRKLEEAQCKAAMKKTLA